MEPWNLSASGGHASSGNGDSVFSAGGNRFGGLNYSGGPSPWLIAILGVTLLGAIWMFKHA